jgi:hypothetical protein
MSLRALDVTDQLLSDPDPMQLETLAGELKRSVATLRRWAKDGILATDGGRVRLESFRLGGVIQTSRPAWQRFVRRLNGQSEPAPVGHDLTRCPAGYNRVFYPQTWMWALRPAASQAGS